MNCHVEHPAYVGKEREEMKDGGAHWPEAMRIEREHNGRRSAKEIECQMTAVEGDELDRDEAVEQRVAADHRQRYRRHRPFGAAPAPDRVAKRNQQKSHKKCRSHYVSFSCRLPLVNRLRRRRKGYRQHWRIQDIREDHSLPFPCLSRQVRHAREGLRR